MDNSQAGSKLGNFLTLRQAILKSGLFDSAWYRRQSGEALLWPSALIHYLLRGWRQGLDPSPLFDTRFYLERYRDVRGSDANPLMHYVLHGKEEGRLATQSGAIYRESLHPELSPLPIFAVPGTPGSRLSVVIDDHTPKLLVLGYVPLLALAAQTAAAAQWTLRIIVRSQVIGTAEISEAINDAMPSNRPLLEITSRTPGHTEDVDALEGEHWWATSISSFESLRTLVPASQLQWVITADEPSRLPAGELAVRAGSALADKHTRTIVLGNPHLDHATDAVEVSTLPGLLPSPQGPTGGLAVVVDTTSPESLVARSVQAIDEALARGVQKPDDSIKFIGLQESPITLMGSVVATQEHARSLAEWAAALGRSDRVLVVRSGSEGALLADQLRQLGATVIDVHPGTTPAVDDVSGVAEALGAAPKKAKAARAPRWDRVTKTVIASMGARA